MYANYEGSAQILLGSPPGQLASASPNKKSKIEFKYVDWGKPININNSQVLPPQIVPQDPQPQIGPQIPSFFQMHPPPQDPPSIPLRIAAALHFLFFTFYFNFIIYIFAF